MLTLLSTCSRATNPHGYWPPGSRTRRISLVPVSLSSGSPALGPPYSWPFSPHSFNPQCICAPEFMRIMTFLQKHETGVANKKQRNVFLTSGTRRPSYTWRSWVSWKPWRSGTPCFFSGQHLPLEWQLTNIRRSWLQEQRGFLFVCFLFYFIYMKGWIGRVATWPRKGIMSRTKHMDSNNNFALTNQAEQVTPWNFLIIIQQ